MLLHFGCFARTGWVFREQVPGRPIARTLVTTDEQFDIHGPETHIGRLSSANHPAIGAKACRSINTICTVHISQHIDVCVSHIGNLLNT